MSEDHEYLFETPTESSSPDADGKFENTQPEVPTQDSILENWEDDSLGYNSRKRSETPPENIRAGDEARYAEQEERAAKRADHDMDYQEKSSTKSISD
ncbi:uncharacterized protein N7484_008242 [Penicillium longicatenatum]|uniref:uncharacterized protein n=1 Tax=Penicillium longicatenatum TaxID=1561947 RepID=UPI0025475801|nr:uncharacterized protein N7484_008242 [Penicillium longicatenatum]KAJ5634929.1 hypothetical protein N7484_008242 [Penicillium longicatenatum]